MVKKRPCSVCGRWFWPDPRVGVRQRVCGEEACQRERHRRDCARYREENREDERTFRLKARIRGVLERADTPARVEKQAGGTLLPERHLRTMMRDEIRTEVPEIFMEIHRVLSLGMRDERRSQVTGMIEQFRIEVPVLVRDEIARSLGASYLGAQEAHDASGMSPAGP